MFLFEKPVNDTHDLQEYIGHGVVAVYGAVVAVMQIIMRDRFCLIVINGNAVTDGIQVVVRTSADFAALDETYPCNQQADGRYNSQSRHTSYRPALNCLAR